MISRRIGERIVIGDAVEVTVTEIHRRCVRLAIRSAPGQIVLRGEVHDAIEGANKRAALSPLDDRALLELSQLESSSIAPAPASLDIANRLPAGTPVPPADSTVTHSKQE